MKPTPEDAQPRRDKWHEHEATWGEVTKGTVVATSRRTERWEIIDVAHGLQVEHGHTLWMRAREMTTGAEYTISPKLKTNRVFILTQDPADTEPPPFTLPSDAETMRLLVEELGASEIATYDAATGEVTCPKFEEMTVEETFTHLRVAHGLDTAALEALPWEERNRAVPTAHGHAHNPEKPTGKGGFPHRHIPEDLTIYTGRRR